VDIASFFAQSQFHMTDVGGKTPTCRRAIAMGRIQVGAAALELIVTGGLPKGDVLKLAETAGIQGAKNTSTTIPLCHPLPLDYVAVHLEPEPATASVAAYCIVSATAKTGVAYATQYAITTARMAPKVTRSERPEGTKRTRSKRAPAAPRGNGTTTLAAAPCRREPRGLRP
jgi:molybdenum cofactor biosynthesis protein MoaC